MNDQPTVELLRANKRLWENLPAGSKADAALDRRDRPEHETAWLAADEAVHALLAKAPPSADQLRTWETLATEAFVMTCERTQHYELSVQVSEDITLLAQASYVGYRSIALDTLWASYVRGTFPSTVAVQTEHLVRKRPATSGRPRKPHPRTGGRTTR